MAKQHGSEPDTAHADPKAQVPAALDLPSAEQYRFMVEHIEDYALFMLNPDGYIVSWNKGAEELFGWSQEEAIGQQGEIVFTPEDKEADIPAQELQQANEEGKASDDRWLIRKNGRRFCANGITTCLRGTDGQMMGYAKIVRDITERVEAEERRRQIEQALQRSEERFSKIFYASPLPIMLTTLDEGRIIDINDAALS